MGFADFVDGGNFLFFEFVGDKGESGGVAGVCCEKDGSYGRVWVVIFVVVQGGGFIGMETLEGGNGGIFDSGVLWSQ